MARIKILYIAGLGRNGGTLLDRTLGQVAGLQSLGEVHFLWQKGLRDNELCGCRTPFAQCEFWQPVLAEAFGAHMPDAQTMVSLGRQVDRTRHIPRLLLRWRGRRFGEALQRYRTAWSRVLGALHRQTGGAVLVDSSKFASRALILCTLAPVDLYVVHLVRDSRAVAFSWQKRTVKPEVLSGDAYLRQYSPLSAAVQWLYRNWAAQALRRRSHAYQRLRYEDWVANPREQTQALLRWLGCDSQAPFTNADTVQLSAAHTQSGNPVRFVHGEVKVRHDDVWRQQLNLRNKLMVTLITLPLLLHYRYRLRG